MKEQVQKLQQKISEIITHCKNDGYFDQRKVSIANTKFEEALLWLKDADNRKVGGTPIDRMQIEADDLDEKLLKLEAFVAKGKPDFLDDTEWSLLNQQAEYMVLYRDTLESRLEIAKEKQAQS